MYLAHAFGQRYELPLPLKYFVLGGAAVVFLSFLLVLPRQAAAADGAVVEQRGTPTDRARTALAALGVMLVVALIAVGLAGSQEVAENILPTWFWLVVWIAVPLSCGLLGDWTWGVNPFATLARLADSDRIRAAVLGSARRLAWPRWLGWWPAVVTYFVVACGELVYNQTATLPEVTAVGLFVGAAVSAVMGLLFGAEVWLAHGEMFSVLFATWGRLGFFRFGASGRRGFAGGLRDGFEARFSQLVFVLMLLVSVSFDGLISTPAWSTVRRHMDQISHGSAVVNDALSVAVFLLLAAATLAVFTAFAGAVARVGGHGTSATAALAALIPSLLPIAFGYLLAHNLQYLLVNGQLLIPLIGNPTGKAASSWLPAPFDDSFEVHRNLLPSAFYWYAAMVIIVAVHVVAVVIAHRHLAVNGDGRARARRSEYPWMAAMVAYTMLSLWLLAQPLVKDKPSGSSSSAAAPVSVSVRSAIAR